MPSDRSQTQKDKSGMIHLHDVPRGAKCTGTGSRMTAAGLGEGNGELASNGDSISVWEDEKVLETDGGDGCPSIHLGSKCT